MNCHEFQNHLTEYVAERVTALQSAEMNAHAAACSVCAHEEIAERSLRSLFAAAPPGRECPDLQLSFLNQIHASPQPRYGVRVWTFRSALALTAALVGLLWMHDGAPRSTQRILSSDTTVQVTDQASILQMVGDMRQNSLVQSDTLLETIQSDQKERSILLGSRGTE